MKRWCSLPFALSLLTWLAVFLDLCPAAEEAVLPLLTVWWLIWEQLHAAPLGALAVSVCKGFVFFLQSQTAGTCDTTAAAAQSCPQLAPAIAAVYLFLMSFFFLFFFLMNTFLCSCPNGTTPSGQTVLLSTGQGVATVI